MARRRNSGSGIGTLVFWGLLGWGIYYVVSNSSNGNTTNNTTPYGPSLPSNPLGAGSASSGLQQSPADLGLQNVYGGG